MTGSNHKNAPLQWSVFVTKRPGLNRELPPGYESLALLWQILAIDLRNWIERSRWRGIEFVAGVGVPTVYLRSVGASNE
jgi:hypothetical protein